MSLVDDPTELDVFASREDVRSQLGDEFDEFDDEFDGVHPSSFAWSVHVALALGVGLLVSWSSLMGALDGSVSLRDALVQLAATATVALLGITFVAALYRFLVDRSAESDESVVVAEAVPAGGAGSDESDV